MCWGLIHAGGMRGYKFSLGKGMRPFYAACVSLLCFVCVRALVLLLASVDVVLLQFNSDINRIRTYAGGCPTGGEFLHCEKHEMSQSD